MSDFIHKGINLDLDKLNMRGSIMDFPSQIAKSFDIMKNWFPTKNYSGIKNIIVLGMGGSAIGGDVTKVIIQNHCLVPIIINRSYNIPIWVDSSTLVIASSYSGDTEETLSAFSQCLERKCRILVLSTGGLITQYADDMRLDRVMIPKGYQPRAALGFSFTLILLVLKHLGFIPITLAEHVEKSITSIEKLCKELSQEENAALEIAERIYSTCPIIYGSEDLTWVVALRFRGQLAENAKMLSFHHNFPEQNHNEIEGWTFNVDIMSRFSIIWLQDKEDHSRNQERMDISSSLLESIPDNQLFISQSGANKIERLIKLIHYTDWISYYVALLNNVDPSPVTRIQEIKSLIAKIA